MGWERNTRDRDCGSENERENGYEKREVGEMQGVREREADQEKGRKPRSWVSSV